MKLTDLEKAGPGALKAFAYSMVRLLAPDGENLDYDEPLNGGDVVDTLNEAATALECHVDNRDERVIFVRNIEGPETTYKMFSVPDGGHLEDMVYGDNDRLRELFELSPPAEGTDSDFEWYLLPHGKPWMEELSESACGETNPDNDFKDEQ